MWRLSFCQISGRVLSVARKFVWTCRSTLGLAELVPVARDGDGVTPLASGYLTLQSLVRADGYVLVPADSEGYSAGTSVQVRPWP